MPQSDQGITPDRFTVIPRVLIFLTRGESVLLLKGAPTKRLWAGKYNGVGGHIEQGEDALTAANRELFEETGLRSALRLAGTVIVDAGGRTGVCLFVFRGESESGEPSPSAEGQAEWMPLSLLNNYPLVEDVAVLLNRLRGMSEFESPFSARSYYDAQEKLRVVFTK